MKKQIDFFETHDKYVDFFCVLMYHVLMDKIILASNNKGKLAEIRQILKTKYEVLSLKDCGIKIDIEETGNTYEENAKLKAIAVYEIAGIPVISDDSGLSVNALDGEPGIFSARYAGKEHDDDANNAKLLLRLEDKADRTAAFVCCAVYYDGNRMISAFGKVEGRILYKAEGDGGFGYDPLFFCDEIGKSFGVASPEEKNSVSHRARAFAALADKI